MRTALWILSLLVCRSIDNRQWKTATLEETLTVWKLDLPEPLRRFFATTNAIENVLGVVRRVSRNVKHWRHGAMAKRWTGIGLVAAEKRFKRIKGHRHMPALVEALSRRAAKGIDQEECAG